jgi:hypothetical protein
MKTDKTQTTKGSYLFGEYVDMANTKQVAIVIRLPYRPSWIKRFCMKHLLGFNWIDNKQ